MTPIKKHLEYKSGYASDDVGAIGSAHFTLLLPFPRCPHPTHPFQPRPGAGLERMFTY
jgi:hypothetical protein